MGMRVIYYGTFCLKFFYDMMHRMPWLSKRWKLFIWSKICLVSVLSGLHMSSFNEFQGLHMSSFSELPGPHLSSFSKFQDYICLVSMNSQDYICLVSVNSQDYTSQFSVNSQDYICLVFPSKIGNYYHSKTWLPPSVSILSGEINAARSVLWNGQGTTMTFASMDSLYGRITFQSLLSRLSCHGPAHWALCHVTWRSSHDKWDQE